MSAFEPLILNIAGAAIWQCLWYCFRYFYTTILPRLAFFLGTLLILIGDWLQKKGGLNVKPLLALLVTNHNSCHQLA